MDETCSSPFPFTKRQLILQISFFFYLGHLFLINCKTNISYKNLGSAGGTKIKIKSVVSLRDEKRN